MEWAWLCDRRHAHAISIIIAQLIAALASLIKRGWLDEPEHQAIFAEVEQACRSSAAAQEAHLRILEALVLEFSPLTASPMQLPWEFHSKCRASFEAEFLQRIFVHAVGVAQQWGTSSSTEEQRIAVAAAKLLSVILEWDFRHSEVPVAAVAGSMRLATDVKQVTPSRHWRGVLLAPQTSQWLATVLPRLTLAASQQAAASPLAAAARQLLVRLMSVSGDIFVPPPPAVNEPGRVSIEQITAAAQAAKTAYLAPLLNVVMLWIRQPLQALQLAESRDNGELQDACLAIAAAAPTHRAAGFQAACPPGEELPGGAVGAIAGLTCAAITAGGLGDIQNAASDALELLTEAWVDLTGNAAVGRDGQLDASTAEAAAHVFRALVQGSLDDMAAGAHEEAETEEAEQEAEEGLRTPALQRAAAVARAAPAMALPLLAAAISEKQQQLQHCASSGSDPSVPLEQLWWLTRIAGHVLADAGEGETPLPPASFAAACRAAPQHRQPDPVAALSAALLGVLGLSLDPAARPVLSSRLLEAAVLAAARWAHTYLMPEEAVSQQMHDSFGTTPGGGETAELLVRVAGSLLGSWPGEVALHRAVVSGLLEVLAEARPSLAAHLLQTGTWHSLSGAFAEQQEAVKALAPPLQRSLARALLSAGDAIREPAALEQYVSGLLRGLSAELQGLAERQDLNALAGNAAAQHRLCCLLEALRGTCSAVTARTQRPVFAALRALVQPLLRLAEAFHGHSAATTLVLKLAGGVVEAHVSYLEAADAALLCNWVVALLQQYSRHNLGVVALDSASSLKKERDAERGRDVRALLRLLMHLTQRDLVDFGSDPDGAVVDSAQAVFVGLDIVIPLMSGELLAVPKLARLYFELLAYLLEVWPAQVASLPGEQFRRLVGSLEYGLASADAEVAGNATEGLFGLAAFHVCSRAEGGPGLAAHNAPGADGKSLLSHFLEATMRRLLLEDAGRETAERSADALLALVLAEPATFKTLGDTLVAGQHDPQLAAALNSVLAQLMGSNGIQQSLDRQNRRQFRRNLHNFAANARSIVRRR